MANQEELTYCIALTWHYRWSPRKARALLERYNSCQEAFSHIEEQQTEALEHAKREIEFIQKHQLRTYFYRDNDYPYRLAECPDTPILLYGKGNLEINKGKFVSIVGTRSATDRSKELTHHFVLELAERVPDVTIVSGLAYGIDVAAHRAALDANIPTIIIPAHGLDRIYPALHRPVAVASLERGGILTEYTSGTEPEAMNFVARNRIIAGLSDAVVVVESKAKGGSLITANMACDYARELFAFPGRPNDVNSQGCNHLIRTQKATLINNADDLVQAMQWDNNLPKPTVQTEMQNLFETRTEEEHKIIELLRQEEDGLHINQIVQETNIAYSQVSSTLMMLEIDGWVKSLPGGMYRTLK